MPANNWCPRLTKLCCARGTYLNRTYIPTPIPPAIQYQVSLHWHKHKMDFEIPDYYRGFGYQS